MRSGSSGKAQASARSRERCSKFPSRIYFWPLNALYWPERSAVSILDTTPGHRSACIPMEAPKGSSGALWLREINGARVRLYSHPGNDLDRRLSSRRGLFRGSWSGAGIRVEAARRRFPS